MISVTNLTSLLLKIGAAGLSLAIAADGKGIRSRQLQERICDKLDACYLVNAKTLGIVTSIRLTSDSVTSFELDPANEIGYSVRCDVQGKNGTSSDYITFLWEDMSHTEWAFPRFMYGSADKGAYIIPVPYLSTCGIKEFNVAGHIWTRQCFMKKLVVNAVSANGKSCPGSPTLSPAKRPTPVIVTKAPIAVPVKSPRRIATKTPTKSPRKAPVAVPAVAPVNAPVRTPRKVPIAVPVNTPVRAPRKTPVVAPVRPPANPDPVPVPVFAPVVVVPVIRPVQPPVPPPVPVQSPVKPDPAPVPVVAVSCRKNYIYRHGKCIWAPVRYWWNKFFN